MTSKSMLAIIVGIVAVAGVFTAYAIVGIGMKDNGNGSIAVNEQKRGKGTVETLEFKNPVTIRLIDKDGNVAAEKVVYNAITAGGKEYIYEVLGKGNASIAELNRIRFFDGTNPTTAAFLDPDGTTVVTVTNDTEICTPSATPTETECVGTFTFGWSGYTPNQDGNLTLDTSVSIQTGHHDCSIYTIL